MRIEDAIKQKKFRDEYQKLTVNIAYTNSYIAQILSSYLKPYDLTMQQFNVLRIVRGKEPNPVSINAIGERMIDKMSNASRLVEKLYVKKLVNREKCASDKRQMDVSLTGKGREVLSALDQEMKKFEKNFQVLNIDEAKLLNDLLDKLRINEQK